MSSSSSHVDHNHVPFGGIGDLTPAVDACACGRAATAANDRAGCESVSATEHPVNPTSELSPSSGGGSYVYDVNNVYLHPLCVNFPDIQVRRFWEITQCT